MLALHVTTLCCRRENLDVNDKIFQTLLKTLKSRFLELFGHMQKLRYFKGNFTEEKLRLRKSFTLRQTPHMSLPTPQVPPPCTDVPHPDPPVFFAFNCFSILFLSLFSLGILWLTCWRVWHDNSWVLASGGAATNARVVWLHAGGTDRLLSHLERRVFALSLVAPGTDKASDGKLALPLCSIASCTQSCS